MIGSQTSSTSSASARRSRRRDGRPPRYRRRKSGCRNAAAGRRRNRPGNEMDRAEIGHDSGLGEGLPGARPARRSAPRSRAEHQAGFLVGFADGGERIAGALTRSAVDAQHQPRGVARVQRRSSRHQPIGGLNAPAGKHEFPGQELWLLVAASEQHLRHAFGAIDQNQRGGIARPQIGERSIAAALVSRSVRSSPCLSARRRTRTVVTHECLPRSPRRFARRADFSLLLRPVSSPFALRLCAARTSRKRNAPATGAASTSSTVTGSPSRYVAALPTKERVVSL